MSDFKRICNLSLTMKFLRDIITKLTRERGSPMTDPARKRVKKVKKVKLYKPENEHDILKKLSLKEAATTDIDN